MLASGLHTDPRRVTLPSSLGGVTLVCAFFWPFLRFSLTVCSVLITLIVSWLALATNTRLLSGVMTMSQGSAPVVIVPRRPALRSTFALNLFGFLLVMRMTVTVPAAVLATYTCLSSGSMARLCGSSPTLIVLITWRSRVRITETEPPAGLMPHTNRALAEIWIGLELVGFLKTLAPCASVARTSAARSSRTPRPMTRLASCASGIRVRPMGQTHDASQRCATQPPGSGGVNPAVAPGQLRRARARATPARRTRHAPGGGLPREPATGRSAR